MTLLSNVILRDTLANRPAAGTAGRLFYDSTNSILYRDNGASWDNVEGTGAAGGFIAKRYLNKPAGNITRATNTVGAFSTAWQIPSVVVASGQNVLLDICATFNKTTANDVMFAVLRGSTQLASWNTTNLGSTVSITGRFTWIDENPGAGTYTYEVQGALFTTGTLTVYQTNVNTDSTGGSSLFVAEVYTP